MTAMLERPVPTGEAPRTLTEPPPQPLGLVDQVALWGNLGITLTLPVAAAFVLRPFGVPPLSLAAALAAVVVGTVIGTALLGLAAVPGAQTGAPAMVLLRGLLGRRASYAPTVLNLLQCVGWATVEIVVIAEVAARLTSHSLRPLYVLLAGALATVMAIRPLGVVRVLRRYAVWAALAATAYLLVQVLREPLSQPAGTSWSGFWLGTDVVIAIAISWAPLAADYTRHSRSARAAFGGAFLGFSAASILYFGLGVLAIAAATQPDIDVIDALLRVPAAGVALLILVVDEVDEAFANVYSTAISAQNLGPRVDRRGLAVAVGGLAIALAFAVDIVAYQNFLYLIGSVFVPLYGAFIADYYLVRRGRWDVSPSARERIVMLVPWALGFIAYQLINAGSVSWWSSFWLARQADLGFTPATWMSASLVSFAVSGLVALVVGQLSRD
ncbi:MAG: cytosine permease [Frankia sp.]|nr:cytosine permease [Frankia sp.]